MGFWQHWQQRHRLRKAAEQIARARRFGDGVRLGEWEHDLGQLQTGEIEPLVEAMLEWCRQTMGTCRRPWGIDYFDLAVACSCDEASVRPTSVSFRRLRPADLYGLDGFRQRLAAFLSELRPDAAPGMGGRYRVAAALFSWGNAAHAALSAPA